MMQAHYYFRKEKFSFLLLTPLFFATEIFAREPYPECTAVQQSYYEKKISPSKNDSTRIKTSHSEASAEKKFAEKKNLLVDKKTSSEKNLQKNEPREYIQPNEANREGTQQDNEYNDEWGMRIINVY